MTDAPMQALREQFEAWFRTTEYAIGGTLQRWPNDANHDGDYIDLSARAAWSAWRARAALAAADAVQPVAADVDARRAIEWAISSLKECRELTYGTVVSDRANRAINALRGIRFVAPPNAAAQPAVIEVAENLRQLLLHPDATVRNSAQLILQWAAKQNAAAQEQKP